MQSRSTLPQRSHNEITAQLTSQLRHARFTVEDYNRDRTLMLRVDEAPCITFGQFRQVAKQQGWTVESLAAFVKGGLDESKRTIERILKTGPAETVIPYTCLIELYQKATLTPPAPAGAPSCACGCGGKVRGKQKFATSACQRRAHRQHHPTQLVQSASKG
jgi:hypothetical protein